MATAKLGPVSSPTGLRSFIDAIGAAAATALFFRSRNVAARVALEWGMVNDVVPDEELAERAVAYAASVAANAPLSLTGNKRVIRELLAAEARLEPDVEQEL